MISADVKVWIDVLLSAGVQVEVCKVKAKDGGMSGIGPKKRKASTETAMSMSTASRKSSKGQSGSRGDNGWSKVKQYEWGSGDERDEDDEWKHETGDEGKAEGRLERKI